MVRWLIVAGMLLSFSCFAQLNGFKKHFKLEKNSSGDVTYVQMNMVSSFSLRPYLEQVKEDLKSEIRRMQQKGYDAEIEAFIEELEESSDKSQESQESIWAVRDSLKNLKNIKVDEVFTQVESRGVLGKFEEELKKALKVLDLRVIASTEDPRYFFKRNVTYEVVTRALNFAKERFDNIPVLNLVSTIIVQVHEQVLEQRLF